MTKVPYNGEPFGGAQVAAYIGAQSVMQRLNVVVPGCWRQEFRLLQAAAGAKKRYMTCKLIITLPVNNRGHDVEAVYEDVGELEVGSRIARVGFGRVAAPAPQPGDARGSPPFSLRAGSIQHVR